MLHNRFKIELGTAEVTSDVIWSEVQASDMEFAANHGNGER
jgi:hypothetical protein